MRRMLAHGLTLLSLALPAAAATTFSTDLSDLWSAPAEPGWGVNVVQQGDTLFLTFFVYSQGGEPVWYVAPSVPFSGTADGPLTFSGALYTSSGPWFGNPFIVSPVNVRPVGAVTFAMAGASKATVSYTVDGTSVSHEVERLTWRTNDIAGSYIGAQVGNYSGGCPLLPGPADEPATFLIATSPGGMEMVAVTPTANCALAGAYVQSGRMGSSSGNLLCSTNRHGRYTASEIEAGVSGLTGRLSLRFDDRCAWDGRFGGIRRGP